MPASYVALLVRLFGRFYVMYVCIINLPLWRIFTPPPFFSLLRALSFLSRIAPSNSDRYIPYLHTRRQTETSHGHRLIRLPQTPTRCVIRGEALLVCRWTQFTTYNNRPACFLCATLCYRSLHQHVVGYMNSKRGGSIRPVYLPPTDELCVFDR